MKRNQQATTNTRRRSRQQPAKHGTASQAIYYDTRCGGSSSTYYRKQRGHIYLYEEGGGGKERGNSNFQLTYSYYSAVKESAIKKGDDIRDEDCYTIPTTAAAAGSPISLQEKNQL